MKNKFKIQSVFNRIYVKRLAEPEVKGILVPDKYKELWMIGEVIHVGPACEVVKEGDKILFAKYSGHQIPVDFVYIGEEYSNTLVMSEENILAVLQPEVELQPA